MDVGAIKVINAGKTFKLPREKNSTVKAAFINVLSTKRGFELQRALNDISFEVKKGEFFGIVGRNGSGKSTLLKLLAGIYTPTTGQVDVSGSLTPFIELGVGFNPELTGRENVYLNGALLGFNRKEMNAMYKDIVSFAELQKFMDQKLKNYSSGMQVRLAFSIAIRSQSDILLLDEVLAVGDAIFQKKCYDYFKTLKKDKRTVIFVSHDSNALLEYCDRGILLEQGDIIYSGTIDKVVKTYLDLLNQKEEEQTTDNKTKTRWGTGDIRIVSTAVGSAAHKEIKIFDDSEKSIYISVTFKAKKNLERPVYGITITDVSGQTIFQSNTLWRDLPTDDITAGQEVKVGWLIPNAFNTGTFYVSPASADSTGTIIYEWLDDAASFKIRKNQKSHGFINIDHRIELDQ